MILVSDYDVIVEPVRSVIITLQLILGIGCILLGVLSLLQLKKTDPNMSKTYFLGIPLFFMLIGVARLVLIYHDYYASDDLDIMLWVIANIIVMSGFILLNHVLETHVYPKTKHVFTILGVILLIIHLVFVPINKDLSSILLYIANASQIFPPFAIYLIVARSGAGIVKKRAWIIVFGMLMLIISQATGIFVFIGLMDRITSSIFAPPTALIGLSILAYGFVKKAN